MKEWVYVQSDVGGEVDGGEEYRTVSLPMVREAEAGEDAGAGRRSRSRGDGRWRWEKKGRRRGEGETFAAHVLTTPQLHNLLVRFADVAAERPRDDGQSTDAQSMERIELSGPAAECQNPMYADSTVAAAAEHVQEFLQPVGTEAHSQEEIEQKKMKGGAFFGSLMKKSSEPG